MRRRAGGVDQYIGAAEGGVVPGVAVRAVGGIVAVLAVVRPTDACQACSASRSQLEVRCCTCVVFTDLVYNSIMLQ